MEFSGEFQKKSGIFFRYRDLFSELLLSVVDISIDSSFRYDRRFLVSYRSIPYRVTQPYGEGDIDIDGDDSDLSWECRC